uniref:N-acetyltransferase domain-containing protein n=1 Tax=Oryza meridionalis TaxID=40149 RepID=A0A0E0CGP5_9ORYZ
MGEEEKMVRVREFIMEKDLPAVEELERLCQAGLSGDNAGGGRGGGKKKRGMSLYAEQIGDPFARVRHAPDHVILVAECGDEVVGVIKACVRMVTRGSSSSSSSSSLRKTKMKTNKFVKAACLLGLRVSPSHRRLGIATELVRRAEEWCAARGATYATMATTASNAASLALFQGRFKYAPFRKPRFLGHPVHRHRARVPRAHRVLQLPPPLAAAAYAALLPAAAAPEFVPADLPALLAHKLTRGTYLAVERSPGAGAPSSFAVLSVYDATRSLSFRVGGAPPLLRASLAAARALDRRAPWLRVPSVPDVFRPFGAYLLYGLHMSGPAGAALLRTLCRHAHNVARNNPACAVVAADVAPDDPAAAAVPHWRRFSCDEDVWCIKKLTSVAANANAGDDDNDWTAAPPSSVLFVDPREF